MSGDIQPAVRQLIHASITSIHKLEVLLFVRAQADRSWDAARVGRELRTDARSAARSLAELAEDGILARESEGPGDLYRYRPTSPELAAAIEAMAEAYQLRRVAVIELIYQGPQARIRSFAEAFRIRKDGDDG